MIVLDLATLRARLGEEIGASKWIEVTQTRIDRFAELTEDRQWIHVDAARAAAESPYRTTIAHGFLTLSLVSHLFASTVRLESVRMAINYGMNRVRFIAPVPAGSRIRARFLPAAAEEAPGSSIQVTWKVTVERDGSERPCAEIEWLVRYYGLENGGRSHTPP